MTDHIEDSPIKKKNRGGRPPNSIWEDINKRKAVGSGKFAASCKYCNNTWSRSEVSKLEEHLLNHCPDASAAVVRRIVEHPFFINFIKELNARYNIPTREVLVNQLLERELAQVNFKVNSKLEKETNLTLAFDGWMSGTHLTIIEKVIEGIGEDQICAVVSDNVANVRNAQKIIHENHPTIENANAKLAQIIKEKGISGGGLKLYCKTRWTTASESVNSVINLESALEEMASDHDKVLTNDKIKPIIQSRNFFSNLRVLGFVLDPLRKVILSLESRRATLADFFLSLARLAATLKKLPKSLNPAF
ncbi:ribonuclease H-like domain-containing protein [Rhizophagus irregularis DAOM 181602=DAOM 197198]|nr:ribonuclease H-like domain-containing protein [Rhizophagus irregularis DAOM 181602=DAOM 197198]